MLSNARASCRMICDHLGTIGGPYVGNGTAQFRACGPRALGTSYWLSPGARGPQGPAQGWAGRARRHDPHVSNVSRMLAAGDRNFISECRRFPTLLRAHLRDFSRPISVICNFGILRD